jgi:hypothetical protein
MLALFLWLNVQMVQIVDLTEHTGSATKRIARANARKESQRKI